jgi:hypothetical protein
MNGYVCRVCALENEIKVQVGGWQAIGHCPVCGERHALFAPANHGELTALLAVSRCAAARDDGTEAERSDGDE